MGRFRLNVVESERGWGQRYEEWDIAATTLEEAQVKFKEFNADNTLSTAPDWYMKATGIEKLDEETGTWFRVKTH